MHSKVERKDCKDTVLEAIDLAGKKGHFSHELFVGCYRTGPSKRTVSKTPFVTGLTYEECEKLAAARNVEYFGLEDPQLNETANVAGKCWTSDKVPQHCGCPSYVPCGSAKGASCSYSASVVGANQKHYCQREVDDKGRFMGGPGYTVLYRRWDDGSKDQKHTDHYSAKQWRESLPYGCNIDISGGDTWVGFYQPR